MGASSIADPDLDSTQQILNSLILLPANCFQFSILVSLNLFSRAAAALSGCQRLLSLLLHPKRQCHFLNLRPIFEADNYSNFLTNALTF